MNENLAVTDNNVDMANKPYSREFLIENREKIYREVTNEHLIECLIDVAVGLEDRGLCLNAAPVREAARRIENNSMMEWLSNAYL